MYLFCSAFYDSVSFSSVEKASFILDTLGHRLYAKLKDVSYDGVENVFMLYGAHYFIDVLSSRDISSAGDGEVYDFDWDIYKLVGGVPYVRVLKSSFCITFGGASFKVKAWVKYGVLFFMGKELLLESCFVRYRKNAAGLCYLEFIGYNVRAGWVECFSFKAKDGLYDNNVLYGKQIGDRWCISSGSPARRRNARVNVNTCSVSGGLKVTVTKIEQQKVGAYVCRIVDIDGLGCFLFLWKNGAVLYWESYEIISRNIVQGLVNIFRIIILEDNGKDVVFYMGIADRAFKCVYDRERGTYDVYHFLTGAVAYRGCKMYDRALLSRELMMTGRIALPKG